MNCREIKGTVRQDKIVANLGFTTRVVERLVSYCISFEKDCFIEELGYYKMTVPHTTHELGTRYAVDKITRIEDGDEGNVLVQYRMLMNGDFVVIAHEPFKGNLIISKR